MVSVAGCEIENVELNGFNSQLNIADATTKIDDIVTSTKSKIILEAGSYDGMKDPVVEDNGELTRIDMTKDKELSVLSIYSNPKKAEYKLNEEIDLTGLIVMGTYTASVEIFKSGGWKGEEIESVTKWENEKDYTVYYDFSTAGVKIVTIESKIATDIKCNFYVYVVDDSQNNGTSQPEKIEFTNIRVESLLLKPKTSYKVGEKLDLSGYRVMGTYNGLDVNLQYTSDPANGTVLEKDVVVKFYYANQEIGKGISIKVTQPCTVEFYDGIDSSKLVCKTEVAFGESLKLPVAPSKTGYTFAGWYNGETKIEAGLTITGDLTLTAKWTANTDTAYKVEHYQQNIDNDEYTLVDTENKTGKTDENTSATAKDYAGFTANTVEQMKIAADGSTVVKIYYDRKEITLTLNLDGGSGSDKITGKYGAAVTVPTNLTKNGYTFDSWYPALPETFPAESSTTYTARWNELNAYYVSSDGDDDYAGTVYKPFATMQKAVNTAIDSNDGETTYTIYVMSDITGTDNDFTNENKTLINVVPEENKSLKLKICGYNNADVTINANQKGRVMYIEANANVTLENITLSNGKIIDDVGGGVCILGGNFTMSNGAVIRDCTSDVKKSGGGGVYISSGEFTMSGGTISWSSDDYCAERGGGVYMNAGTFTMSGSAKIEGCKTYSLGGGVYQAGGKFTMSENAVISGCEAVITANSSESYGGGVYQNAGEFTMSGGTISGCKVYNSTTKTDVKSYGGGVYQNAGTFEMTGGTISGCTAEQGGGVYKYSGVFKMQGGTIGGGEETLGCTANQGGGVYLGSLGSSSISSGIISNCSAKQGGGVYYNGDSNNTFTMYNGEISKCTAEQGGGVYVNNGEFKMSGSAKIDKCEASERGGGVYQNGGRFEIFKNTDGTNNVIISSNTAKSGGGVCVYSGTFSMNSGSISGNKVKSNSAQGGGVLVIGNFFMHNGNITNNKLEYERIGNTLISGGAGVAVSLKAGDNGAQPKGAFTMSGGEISGNTITDNYNHATGEDLFVISGGTFTHTGGTINNDKIYNANNQ